MPRKAAEPPRGGWDIRIDGFREWEGPGIWRPGSGGRGEQGRIDGLGNDSSPRRLQMLQKANVFNQ